MLVATHFLPAYIGPGAGFAFLGSFLTLVLSVLAGIASLLIWPLRWLRSLAARRRGSAKKLIFLGYDGLDPGSDRAADGSGQASPLHASEKPGRLPAFAHHVSGALARGMVHLRDRGQSRKAQYLRFSEQGSANVCAGAILREGNPKVRGNAAQERDRSGKSWAAIHVASTILRVPITFPPEVFNGRLLSAMCTPDLRGTQGSFSQFKSPEGLLQGPEGESIPFRVVRSTLHIQGQSIALVVGEYTPWIRLQFPSARGIVRFLLMQAEPDFALYATPVQIDPESPALPISHPALLCDVSGETARFILHAGDGRRHLGAERRRNRSGGVSVAGP